MCNEIVITLYVLVALATRKLRSYVRESEIYAIPANREASLGLGVGVDTASSRFPFAWWVPIFNLVYDASRRPGRLGPLALPGLC